MQQFLRALKDTSILYWRQRNASFREVILLLVSNGALLVLCRSATFGFDELTVSLITYFFALILQYIAAIASWLRKSKENILIEAPKLAKAIAVVWLVSLILFLPNSIPTLRWFGIIYSSWIIAFLHSAIAVALVTRYSHHRLKASAVNGNEVTKEWHHAYKWVAFFLVVNTVLFNLFVLDIHTYDWILVHYNDLKEIIAQNLLWSKYSNILM